MVNDIDQEFILEQDPDSHWFVIPADKAGKWEKWCAMDPDDTEAWAPPEWAVEINGSPTNVKFKQFRIE